MILTEWTRVQFNQPGPHGLFNIGDTFVLNLTCGQTKQGVVIDQTLTVSKVEPNGQYDSIIYASGELTYDTSK